MNEPSRVTTLALFVLAVAGRFTPGRAGLSAPPWFDLRLAGVLLVVALVLLDRSRTRPVGRADGADDGWLVALLLLLGFLAGSGLWAPTGARVAEITVDLLCLGVQTVCWYLHALSGPERVLDLVLRLWVVTALVFGAGALLAGPGAQGRFAAFGGGPNVFVRIELIGALAVVALVLRGASRALLPVAALLVVLGLLSGSRGGLLAAAVVVAAVALRGGRRARRAVVGGLVTVAGVAFVASRSSPQVQALVRGRFLDQTFGQGYASGRPQIWGDAVALAASRPVAGVGLDGFYALRGRFVDIEYPHNVLLAVMAEGGAVGLLLLLGACARWWRVVRRRPPGRADISAAVHAAAFVAAASLFSGDYYDTRLVCAFAALAAAGVTGVTVRAGPTGSPERRAPRRVRLSR